MGRCNCHTEAEQQQRSTLIMLLLINAVMFVIEFGAGIIAESTGLIADAMDMLADAMVYGIALYAVGRSQTAKIKAAMLSGFFQIALGMGVGIDILRRTLIGSEPESTLMIAISIVALIANVACVLLIAKHKEGEVHMRASWIFSKNDVLANLGVIIGGGFVMLLGSAWPDLVVGALITFIVVRGGVAIINDAKSEVPLKSKS